MFTLQQVAIMNPAEIAENWNDISDSTKIELGLWWRKLGNKNANAKK